MSYKYKAMRQLKHLIDTDQVSGDIDIKKMLKLANIALTQPKPKVYKYDQPRFYHRALSSNTRAKNKGVSGRITADDLELVYKRYNGQCAHCGSREHLVFDHIVAYFNGGDNTVDNLQVLCRICNMLKGAN